MEDDKIKDYFSKDKVVSDKANMVFDSFIKELQDKSDLESVEQGSSNKDNVIDFSSRKRQSGWYKFRKFATVAASLVIVFVGSNAYAHTRGYENIFFLLKDAVTQGSASGKEAIFSDRDIVISYQSFTITDGVEMQVNEIQAVDNNAKLYLLVKESKDSDAIPLYYKVYNENEELMFEGNSSKEDGEKTYTEVLKLNNFTDDTNSVKLEIYKKDKTLLKKVNIDLEAQTIEARTMTNEVQKISQIELNKFLKEETEKIYTEKELKDREIIVLDTYDIYCNDGIYTAKYLFMKPTKEEFDKEKVEESDIYLNSVEFEIKDEKFKILKIEKPEVF